MQDFTKNKVPATNRKPISVKKEIWLSKDRFWAISFLIVVISGRVASEILWLRYENMLVSNLVFWPIFALSCAVLWHFTKTSSIDGKVFNSENKRLKMELYIPMRINFGFLFFWFSMLAFILSRFFSPELSKFSRSFVPFLSMFTIANLYFIYKNFPLVIIFNKVFWRAKPKLAPPNLRNTPQVNLYTDQRRRGFSGNMWTRR